jgi:hypothetical protein
MEQYCYTGSHVFRMKRPMKPMANKAPTKARHSVPHSILQGFSEFFFAPRFQSFEGSDMTRIGRDFKTVGMYLQYGLTASTKTLEGKQSGQTEFAFSVTSEPKHAQ